MNATTSTPRIGALLKPTRIALDPGDLKRALDLVQQLPLPTTRDEAWKYTRVARLGKIAFENAVAALDSVERYVLDQEAPRIVFINGHFAATHSTVNNLKGLTISILNENTSLPATHIPLEGELFNALNTAYLHGGCQLTFSSAYTAERPLQIIHILKGKDVLANFKTLIEVEKSAEASISQAFFSEEGTNGWCNTNTEIKVRENGHLTLEKLQYEGAADFHISTEFIDQERDSTCTINTITLNGGLVRNNVHVAVNGENATSNLHGAYLLKESQHVDNHTVIDHRVANCNSNELYKGVVDDQGTAVFNGKVFVRPDAQKINAFQSNGNVLLTDSASVNSKPELEIYADDVKCSHGSTTGQLDEEAIFYLRARGISEKSARHLMVAAFVGDVFEKIENPALLSFAENLLKERFGWELNP